MANKNINDLVAGSAVTNTDLFLTRQGADTEDKKLQANALLTYFRNFGFGTAGQGVIIKEGTNARLGRSTLVAGTVTVANTSVTANTRFFLTIASGTQTNAGSVRVSSQVNGTSFTITSTNGADTSGVDWMLVEAT